MEDVDAAEGRMVPRSAGGAMGARTWLSLLDLPSRTTPMHFMCFLCACRSTFPVRVRIHRAVVAALVLGCEGMWGGGGGGDVKGMDPLLNAPDVADHGDLEDTSLHDEARREVKVEVHDCIDPAHVVGHDESGVVVVVVAALGAQVDPLDVEEAEHSEAQPRVETPGERREPRAPIARDPVRHLEVEVEEDEQRDGQHEPQGHQQDREAIEVHLFRQRKGAFAHVSVDVIPSECVVCGILDPSLFLVV